ncbi:unnamed protein product [Rotaria socialis]|uniref:Uncharacterized protein n=1 Tax=Rotaria socialis TaxID=392032 RepID=A0A820FRU5_9BILA|nr:unnamed protein product [Rotaria socialis]
MESRLLGYQNAYSNRLAFFHGRRAIGAIIGIISGCCLFLLLIACCIVYYRRYLTRKGINEQTSTEQPHSRNQATNCATSDSPPSYSEAVKGLRDV